MTAETRAQAVVDAARGETFPKEITIGNAVVRMSRPRKVGERAFAFRAVVSVDGKIIDRDTHVIVNPPTLIEDASGNVERAFTNRKGEAKTVRRYRVDPIACAARAALDAALGKKAR